MMRVPNSGVEAHLPGDLLLAVCVCVSVPGWGPWDGT